MRQIIYAWNYRDWGGVQIYFFSLIKEVRQHCRVLAVIPDDTDPSIIDTLHNLGVVIEMTPPAPNTMVKNRILDRLKVRYRNFTSESRMLSRIRQLSTEGDTIVHVDLGFWQSAWTLFNMSRRTSVFFTLHTPLSKQRFLRDLIWKVKGKFVSRSRNLRFLASNHVARQSLERYIGTRAFRETAVTYAGFDPVEIEAVQATFQGPDAIRAKYDIRPGPLVVTVGQFIERKGCWVVADAVKELEDRGHEFTLLWLATNPPDGETRNRLEAYGLSDRLRILSNDDIGGSRSDLLSLGLSADVFLLASLQEGLPIALVEAMALGRPCLTTNVGAIPEAIEDGVSGVLVEPNDPKSLADELEKMILSPEQQRALGARARTNAYERFNETVTATETIRLYYQVWKMTKSQ